MSFKEKLSANKAIPASQIETDGIAVRVMSCSDSMLRDRVVGYVGIRSRWLDSRQAMVCQYIDAVMMITGPHAGFITQHCMVIPIDCVIEEVS